MVECTSIFSENENERAVIVHEVRAGVQEPTSHLASFHGLITLQSVSHDDAPKSNSIA